MLEFEVYSEPTEPQSVKKNKKQKTPSPFKNCLTKRGKERFAPVSKRDKVQPDHRCSVMAAHSAPWLPR